VGSGGGVAVGNNLALAVDYDNAAGDIQLQVLYEPYESFYNAAAAFGPDVANGASAAQLTIDALSTQTLAVSGALGTLGGQSWQQAYDHVTASVATLESHIASMASGTQIFQDTMALDAGVVAGLVGSIAGHVSQTAYSSILQSAGTLGADVASGSSSAQIQADLNALFSSLAGNTLNATAWQQAVTTSMAAAQTLSADIASHANTTQLESDAAALFGTIVSGSLNAIGGSALQQAYANSGATVVKLGSDISGGATAEQVYADVDGLFSAITPAVAGQAAGTEPLDSFHSVTTAAATFGNDLLNGATTVQLLADQLQLLGAVAGARVGDVAGDAAEQAFDQIVKNIGSFQAEFVKSSSASQIKADASTLVSSTIVSTLNVLGPSGLGDAYSSNIHNSDALLADLQTVQSTISSGGVPGQALMDQIAAAETNFEQSLSNLMALAGGGSGTAGPSQTTVAQSDMAAASPTNVNQTLDNAYHWPADPQGIIGTDQPAPEATHPNLEQVGDYLQGLKDNINNDQQVLTNLNNAGQAGSAEAGNLWNRLQQENSDLTYWGQYYANGAAGGPSQAKAWQQLDADIRHGNYQAAANDAWNYYKNWKSFFKDPLKHLEDLAKKYDMNEFNNFFKKLSHMNGDVHITNYDGVHFDFQAVGEFTASKSTAPGDSFDVQIRLEPWFTGSSVSVMTQVAASVGSDRVTFDLHRSDMVWVDGAATTLSAANPTLNLAGGQLTELSPAQFELDWNTGESLKVTNGGSFLNVDIAVNSSVGPSHVQGLLGSEAGAASAFQLPNGTVLSQPLSAQQLYSTFGNAWRITQQESLFDYNAGQSTATFTNLNFPQAFTSLQSLPGQVLNAAGNAVFAAGITDPNIAADAALDFAATGDPSFVTAAAQVDQQVVATTAAGMTGATAAVVLGVVATQATVQSVPSSPTDVTFEVFLTGVLATPVTVAWAAISPDAGNFSAAAFGGTLPSGQVTLNAGQSMADFVVALPVGALGAMASEALAVSISTASGTPIFAATAHTAVTQPFGITSIGATTGDGSSHVAAGDTVTLWVQLSEPVSVIGTPALQLSDSEVSTYLGGSGSSTLTFSYVVHAGDQASDLHVTGLNLGTGDTIKDASGNSLSGAVAADLGIAVGTTVAAHNDAYILTQDHLLSATTSDSVLLNDDNATMTTLVTGPAHGSLQLANDGSFNYTPAAGFAGIDSFTYEASSSAGSSDAQALLYVVPTQGTTTSTLNLLALNAEEQVAATYTAFFSRGADSAGFNFWVGLFNQYLPSLGPQPLFANIASSFGVSNEAKAIYPFLANPNGASDSEISSFLDTVYNNLFNRSSDPAGLAYWTGQIKQTLASGGFVGDVLVNIISGTQVGPDEAAMMGKVAVSLEYVHQQAQHQVQYNGATDQAAATALLHAVTNDPATVLVGIKQADLLIAAHA
jgi:hypothetical protein